MSYDYLPGTQVVTVDGGLAQKRVPQSKSTVILGVAGKGAADETYRVVDRSLAAQEFGYEGNLIQAMEEVAQGGCDNIYLFRMGTSPAVLTGIGAVKKVGDPNLNPATPDVVVNPGFTVTFGARDANVPTDYRIYFKASTSLLNIFYQGNLVYSNDPSDPVDTSDVTVDGAAVAGMIGVDLISAANAGVGTTFDQSLPLVDAAGVHDATGAAPGSNEGMGPVYTHCNDGLALLNDVCGLYEAQARAFQLIEIFPIQRVHVPSAKFDTPSIAFLNDPSKDSINDPSKNTGCLGWLRTFEDSDGVLQFAWAHKALDSTGASAGVKTFTSHIDRLAQDYHEVSFPYQLARFCRAQSQNQGGCFGYIGFNETKSYKPTGLRNWIGFLPIWDVDAVGARTVVTPGKGLCGQPYLVGTTSDKLNPQVHDISTKAYRSAGMFQTVSKTDPIYDGEYDEGPVIDRNNYPVDIGAHIHAVGEWAWVNNAMGTYRANLAGVICGFESNLDPKSAITNKVLPSVSQIYRVTMAQLNSLTKAKVNVLRFKGDLEPAALLHDYTCSTDASDYLFILRQNIKFLLCAALFQEADKFIGESSTDGLQLAALGTALDRRITDLKKRGYIAGCDYVIYSTLADRRIGRAFIDLTFNPPDEAVQIRASIAVGRS
jgi:hypothetical protein